MSDLLLPRTLIIIQVIFGRPLRGTSEFRGGDIQELVAEDFGIGNYVKVLNNLVESGWITRHEKREVTPARGGRPSTYVFRRTQLGRQGYAALKNKLSRYGINLL